MKTYTVKTAIRFLYEDIKANSEGEAKEKAERRTIEDLTRFTGLYDIETEAKENATRTTEGKEKP